MRKQPNVENLMRKNKREWSASAKAAGIPEHIQEKVRAKMDAEIKQTSSWKHRGRP